MMKECIVNSEVAKEEAVNLTWGHQGRVLKEGDADQKSWNMSSVDKGGKFTPQKEEHTQVWEGRIRLLYAANYKGFHVLMHLVQQGDQEMRQERHHDEC